MGLRWTLEVFTEAGGDIDYFIQCITGSIGEAHDQ